MSNFLFNHPAFTTASFVIANKPGADTVSVGKALWRTITQDGDPARACISIRPLMVSPSSHKNLIRAITCWAVPDEQTEESSLAISPEWANIYAHIFFKNHAQDGMTTCSVAIELVTPIPLTEIIVSALSSESYQAAIGENSILEGWFSETRPILRHREVYRFTRNGLLVNGGASSAEASTFQYRIEMIEPVVQGYATRDATKFFTMLADPESNGEPVMNPVEDMADGENSIEIDEDFMANSFLPSSSFSTTASQLRSLHLSNLDHRVEVFASSTFPATPLSSPVSLLGDHSTLYLHTADLGRIGALNDDWAITRYNGMSRYRLVRIVACDDIVIKAGVVAASPILLHNIYPEWVESDSQSPPSFCIHPSPFGFRQPPIPTALSVTIARVASPFSINRGYQSAFVAALKAYFDSSRRLVKQGDIIAVPINTDASRWQLDQDEAADSSKDHIEESSQFSLPACSDRVNEVVYFMITNIEHNVVANAASATDQDMYVGSTIGELGCWVDPAVTRMVQTGIEHARIPNARSYIGLDAVRMKTRSLSSESPYEKIRSFSSAWLAKGAANYNLQLSVVLKGARGAGKFTTVSLVAQRLGMHLLEINCYDILGENDVKTEASLQVRFEQAKACSPCVLVLRHLEAFSQSTQSDTSKESPLTGCLRELVDDIHLNWKMTGFPVIAVGTVTETGQVPSGILSCFKHEVNFEAPNELERQDILDGLLSNDLIAPDVLTSDLATQSAALVASDLVDLVNRARISSIERAMHATGSQAAHLSAAGIPLTAADFELALGKARSSYSESIGAPKIPTVSWDDVGGLSHVKSDILDTIQLPLEHPELFAEGLKRRSGILLYGPPGTGKTLVAKAVATSCSLNFFSVKGPELLNMYIGESEANVRRVFQRARDAKPCVIFFDELDSVAPKRGNHGDSGGVMDRIVSQLLAELDGMSGGKAGADVFVIGATNRPDLLDPALLRPGRFDRMLYLGVSETHEAQLNILEALTRKFRLDPSLDLMDLAQQCPFNYTGADFYALCSDAMLNAMSRKAEELEKKIAILNSQPGPYKHPHPLTPQYFLAEMASSDDISVFVKKQDFDLSLKALVPSVSRAEMEHYGRIQRRFARVSEEVDSPEEY